MNLTDYVITAGISVFFLVVCLVHLTENDIFSMRAVKAFKELIWTVIIAIGIDTLFAVLDGNQDIPRKVLAWIKVIELSLNPIIVFQVVEVFFGKRIGLSKLTVGLRNLLIAIIIANVIFQLVSVFGGYVFYIDENHLYNRGSLMPVYVGILISTILILLVEIASFTNRTQSTMRMTLAFFAIVLNGGILLRAIFPAANYDWLCISVAVMVLIIYYSSMTLRVDGLTHLLNYRVYSRMLEKINYPTVIVMMDVNYLKHINDQFGHESGNLVLKKFAKTICKVYGRYAYCFRFGGDEFCAVLKRGVYEELVASTPNSDAYAMSKNLLRKLDDAIALRVENGEELLKYGVSQGFGIYEPQASEDYYNSDERRPESAEPQDSADGSASGSGANGSEATSVASSDGSAAVSSRPRRSKRGKMKPMTIQEVAALADERMYRNKRLFKKTHPVEEIPEAELETARVIYRPAETKVVDTRD